MKLLFVTGIGTGVGKTLVSAILTETLSADYWKPVQSGFDEGTDSETVKKLISKPEGRIFPEIYLLKAPVSPHAAAKKENISIKIKLLKVPKTKKTLIIEGAGGLMVPLNDHELMVDFIKKLNAEVILVVRHYLGSINHTLLSVKALEVMKIRVAGIIFNGRPDLMSEDAIQSFCNYPIIGRIKEERKITPDVIKKYAKEMKKQFDNMKII